MSTQQKLYGTSAWFKNRTEPNDHHNWLVNPKRPFISLSKRTPKGTKYDDLFLNTRVVNVQRIDGNVVLTFPEDVDQPLFSRTDK